MGKTPMPILGTSGPPHPLQSTTQPILGDLPPLWPKNLGGQPNTTRSLTSTSATKSSGWISWCCSVSALRGSDSNANQVRVHRKCIYISRSRLTKMVFTIPRMQSEPTDCMLIAITCARGLEDELPAPGGVWEAKSRWPLAVGSLVPGSHANQPGSRV